MHISVLLTIVSDGLAEDDCVGDGDGDGANGEGAGAGITAAAAAGGAFLPKMLLQMLMCGPLRCGRGGYSVRWVSGF